MSESVWDYPRPPAIEPDRRLIVVALDGERLVESRNSVRVLETTHPPVFYIPLDDVAHGILQRSAERSFCEYKGIAHYWDMPGRVPRAAWSYPDPAPGYESLRGRVAFYPQPFECTVDGEPVIAQEGGFFGGWITSEVTGPFKGGPGTLDW